MADPHTFNPHLSDTHTQQGKPVEQSQVKVALEAYLEPERALGVVNDLVVGNAFTERVLAALRGFLRDYVQLPPKETVLGAFEQMVDALLVNSTLSEMAKSFVRGAVLIAAEQLYSMIAGVRILDLIQKGD